MFGSINALFSGLAFAGIIYTILLQRKELELQREELKLTREEIKKSREQHEIMATANKDQVMEMRKQSKLDLYIKKLKVRESRIDALQNMLEADRKGTQRLETEIRRLYAKELKKELEKYERLARKDIQKLIEE